MRILIVDDHQMVAAGFVALLKERHDCVAVAHSAREALAAIGAHPVNLVLLDLSMPGQDGFETLMDIRQRWPEVAVIVITQFHDAARRKKARDLGARGFLAKSAPRGELFEAIGVVAKAGEWFPRADEHVSSLNPAITLTKRQAEVLSHVAQGSPYKAIGEALGISYATVDSHIRRLHKALGVATNPALVRAALEHGFLPGLPPVTGNTLPPRIGAEGRRHSCASGSGLAPSCESAASYRR